MNSHDAIACILFTSVFIFFSDNKSSQYYWIYRQPLTHKFLATLNFRQPKKFQQPKNFTNLKTPGFSSNIIFSDTKFSSFSFQSGSLFGSGPSDSGHFSLDLMWLLWDLIQSSWIGPEPWQIEFLVGVNTNVVHDKNWSQEVEAKLEGLKLSPCYTSNKLSIVGNHGD